MKLTKYGLLLGSLALLASCSDNNMDSPVVTPDESNDGLYMTLQIQPLSTRTQTEAEGSEEGQDVENNIGNAWVVFGHHEAGETEYDNVYITYAVFDRFMPTTSNVRYVARGKKAKEDFLAAMGDNESLKFDVYVIANPTEDIKQTILGLTSGTSKLNDLRIKWDGTEEKENTWSTANNFVMTNGSTTDNHTDIEINAADLKADKYNSYENALPLGRVGVQRIVARFDYDVKSHKDQEYTVGDEDSETTVKLVEMALINMNKEFYMLKQVGYGTYKDDTKQELNPAEFKFFADELGYAPDYELGFNFVKDPFASLKAALNSEAQVKNFLSYNLPWKEVYDPETNTTINAFDINSSDVTWTTIDENLGFTGKTTDNGLVEPKEESKTWGNYQFWRYVLPNSVYKIDDLWGYGKTPFSGQRHINSTGVVFKAQITKVGNQDLTTGKALYVFNGVMYGTVNEMRKSYQDALKSTSRTEQEEAFVYSMGLAIEAYNTDKNKQVEFPTEDIMEDLNPYLVSYAFSIYKADETDGNYYCYYYYWNRHNDNNVENVMGPMEFAVVSNNVYKLAVTKIKHFGHPGDPSDDPDPVDPDDPDEDESINTYFVVAVDVLPWVVRVNDIEF